MNGNSSKQVLLSVLGIAVLVVAVVGVSFAFFTYSKNGEANNEITTGSIFLQFTEGTAITLSNQFPINDANGATLTSSVNGDNPSLTFNVIGHNTNPTQPINYTVTASNGGTMSGKTRLHDNEIKLYLTVQEKVGSSGTYGAVSAGSVTNNFSSSTGTVVSSSQTGLASGVVLATGVIPANTSVANQIDHKYTLRMWISDALVSIDENEDEEDDDNVYTSNEFKDLYYTLKVSVTGNAVNPTA